MHNSFNLTKVMNETSTPKFSRNNSKINDFFNNFLSNLDGKRRLSITSTDSNATLPEAGDAIFEWDEYRVSFFFQIILNQSFFLKI